MSYDMIDRFLRNNLGDDDYAEYSVALDSLCIPQPKQEQGEPVAYVVTTEIHGQMCSFICRSDLTKLLPDGQLLYTTPQQRTWVGLTDDDKILIKHDANYNQFMTAGEYADRVQQLTEARIKDKNNA